MNNKYRSFSDPKNIEKMVREIEVLWEEITLEVLQKPYKLSPFRFVGPWIKYVSAPVKNKRVVYLYWDKIPEQISIDDLKKKLQKNPNFFEELVALFNEIYRDYKSYTDKIYKKGSNYYQKLSNQEIANIFKLFIRECKKIAFGYYIPYDLEMASEELLRESIQKIIKDKRQTERYVENISTLGISTFVKEERKNFLKTLTKIQNILKKQPDNWNGKKIEKIIFEQWYKFGLGIYTHGSYKKYKLADYTNKFKKNIKLNAVKELRLIRQNEKVDIQKANKQIKYFQNYPEVIRYSAWLRKAMTDRNCESEKVNIYFYHCINLFYEINNRLEVGKDGYLFLSTKEILKGLKGKLNAQKIVKNRKVKGFTIKQIGNDIKVITGVSKKDLYEKEITQRVKEFTGTATYKGVIKGKAKIVINPRLIETRFKKGDVLVSPATTPEFVPLIKLASAIITDEGGLLCHAAIVSRELKTPCVIGTKIATKVLHDGDLVEVNANKGIVKILKKSRVR